MVRRTPFLIALADQPGAARFCTHITGPSRALAVVPESEVEQLGTERVFVAVPDGHALCAKDAIEWSMLGGEELIVCQSDRTRLTRAFAPQRPNLSPGRPFRCLAHSQDSVAEIRRRVISSRCAAAFPHKTTDQFVDAKVARTAPG